MAEIETPSREGAHAVFFVPELLEKILLAVDMKTLLLSQRVNKFWNQTINNSTLLQKKLFFLPASLDEAINLTAPYQLSTLPKTVDSNKLKESPWVWLEKEMSRKSPAPSHVIVLNPMLFGHTTDRFRICNLRNLLNKQHKVTGSWQRMRFAHSFPKNMIMAATFVNDKDQHGNIIYHDISLLGTDVSSGPPKLTLDLRDGTGDLGLAIGETARRVEQLVMFKKNRVLDCASSYFVVAANSISLDEYEKEARERHQNASTTPAEWG